MDGEQNTDSDKAVKPQIDKTGKPQEVGTSQENPHEVFRQTLEMSKQAMDALVDFATQNGALIERFSHLARVFEVDGHVLLPPMETMRSELVKIHGESDRTMRTRALMARKTGQVFVPEEQAGSVHDVFHESIHRAAWLRDRELGLSTNTTDIVRQLASQVTISADGKVDPNGEYIRQFCQTDQERENLIRILTETLRREAPRVTEGLTEWATQRANGMTTKEGVTIKMEGKDMAYEDEVQYINEVRAKLIEKEGLTADQADARIITAAIIGDISELRPYF